MLAFSAQEMAWFWVLAGPSLAVLAMVLVNLALWPRGRARGSLPGRVTVCIPVRNEGRRIVTCLRAVLDGTQRPDEVLVYDDGSTDGTWEILEQLVERERALRAIRGGELPAGWLGKPWSCHRLAEEATGDVLVFMDADTVATPTCLARLGWVMERWRGDFVSACPRQVTGTLTEQMVVPLLDLAYLSWLPLPLVWLTRTPTIRVSSGQLIAVKREVLERAGGWDVAAHAVADDAVLARRIKEVGGRVVYAQGQNMATGRMFEGRVALWHGLSKTFYHRLVRRPVVLLFALVLYGALFAPYVGLWQALHGHGYLLWPSLLGVAANLLIRSATAIRLHQSSNGIILHPFGLIWLFFIALNSFRLSRRGTLDWRGRRYSLRRRREAEAEASG